MPVLEFPNPMYPLNESSKFEFGKLINKPASSAKLDHMIHA